MHARIDSWIRSTTHEEETTEERLKYKYPCGHTLIHREIGTTTTEEESSTEKEVNRLIFTDTERHIERDGTYRKTHME